jgi:hypothetical protein
MRQRAILAISAVAILVTSAVVVASAASTDPRLKMCPPGDVAMSFGIEHASAFRDVVPGWRLKTPELEGNAAPAYLVIYKGPQELPVFGGRPAGTPDADGGFKKTYDGVVCAVVDDKFFVYYDVDTKGAHAPAN